jgi:hypothetical protein
MSPSPLVFAVPERARSKFRIHVVGTDRKTDAVTVTEFLRLAPFSLGTITMLLAAGGLIFGHAYGRYGDDAAISFLVRWRFLIAAALVFLAPALMLISFARGTVPDLLTAKRAAIVVGLGIGTTAGVVGYLLLHVSRPGRFLSAVGKRVTVRRLNRYALADRWQRSDEFEGEIAARRYRWFGMQLNLGPSPEPTVSRLRKARWTVLVGWMHARRAWLRGNRTDPSEMLFDAAAAGLKNSSMRTWRGALQVIGRRLRDGSLEPAAAQHLIANAQALEEAAHRQGSEDCKVRLCAALGGIGSTALSAESAEILAKGISSLAERRLAEHRPVLAAIEALRAMGAGNAVAAAKTAGWLGQHLASLPPPAAVYGFQGDRLEHPTRALFALLVDLTERADREDDGSINDAVIDACSMIVRKLPDQQDRETIETLGFALGRAGVAAGRRYGTGVNWHGTHDAVEGLVRVHGAIREIEGEEASDATPEWIAEEIGRIGCWVVGNRRSLGWQAWEGRSDMAVLVAEKLLQLPHSSIGNAFVELVVRQHNSGIPIENRDAFIGLCQRMSGDLLGLAVILDDPDESEQEE